MSQTSSTVHQTEQTTTETQANESSAQSHEIVQTSTVSTPAPILPIQTTDAEREDDLVDSIDQLIRNFLSRLNRPHPSRTMFRWTLDNEPNQSYSVVVIIEAPSGFH